ncbi:LysM peptidoglycan-binding domain-containing protein [Roseibium sp. Sym1]|uniref:LysM peptidoglycan-binding domain-containing protein n=1 Tax=Roseibium sp. Sym1 TaxID=3016006 RepID=UPI0022B51BDC|nr:LysM peptidoglycan-binding domain-containing protein [Roseibium sp. Sym1]
MNKKTLVWTLVVAVPVGIAALVTAYIYRDTGKLPFQETTATTAAPDTAGSDAAPEATAQAPAGTGTEETAQADTPAAEGEAGQSGAKGLSFDVVGVETTGETVVAGRSDAGAIVALTANGKVVGTSIANEVGEWTIILDEPLKPGDYDVGLEVHDEAGEPIAKSEQRVVVSLPEGGKEQPLVVLNTPDGPSDILQKPAAEQQVAEAAPAPEAQSQETAGTQAADTGAGEAETTAAALQETEETPAGAEGSQQVQAQSATSADAAGDAETAAAEAAAPAVDETASGTTVADTAEDAVATQETQTASVEPAAETGSASGNIAPDGGAVDTEATEVREDGAQSATKAPAAGSAAKTVAAAPEPQAEPSETVPAVSAEAAPARDAPAEPTVTVEAVESEQDKVFVAGTGEPGSSVRVYVGDDFQGEARVNSGGKWLVQGTKNIAEGNVEVRADLIAEDGSSVDARAAVTFEKEQDKQIVLSKVVASGASGEADGQGAEVKKALPVVIIRKGDNLWRISRRLYGHGVRYTTIYQANQDQIRNPDLIYPGQVFLTPEGDLNWKQLPENNG